MFCALDRNSRDQLLKVAGHLRSMDLIQVQAQM
jgi:hypothetical protein